jgi:hypothetical protein
MLLQRLCVAAAALLAAAAAPAAAARPSPAVSWDRVATFQHLAFVNATLATEFAACGQRLAWLAKFPIVFLEHAHGQPYCYAPPSGPGSTYGPDAYDPSTLSPPGAFFEEHSRAVAAQIKAVNSDAVVIYYQQASAAIPFYRAAEGFTAHPEWRASCPGPLPLRGLAGVGADGVFSGGGGGGGGGGLGDVIPNIAGYLVNHTASGVREWYVSASLNATRGSQLDGTFFDTGGCFSVKEQVRCENVARCGRRVSRASRVALGTRRARRTACTARIEHGARRAACQLTHRSSRPPTTLRLAGGCNSRHGAGAASRRHRPYRGPAQRQRQRLHGHRPALLLHTRKAREGEAGGDPRQGHKRTRRVRLDADKYKRRRHLNLPHGRRRLLGECQLLARRLPRRCDAADLLWCVAGLCMRIVVHERFGRAR